MSPAVERADLNKLFEVWMDSDLKVQVVVFFQNNPGVIDTVEGLARRLGIGADALRKCISDHVKLGFLQERHAGSHVVLVYDRGQHDDLQQRIVKELTRQSREAKA